MKLIFKDAFKKVKSTIGRFLSLFFIVALGVGFFAGIKASKYDMYLTGDKYYDDNNLMDIRITSTLGLTNDDIEEVKKQKGVEEVIPSYFTDAFNNKEVVRVHAINDNINQVWLKDGAMPKNDNECLVEEGTYEIGDTITLTGNNVQENLKNTKLKVVGLVRSPMYIGIEKGITNIGSGKLESFVYVNESNFKMEAYTDLYLKVKDAKNEVSYEEGYTEKIDAVKDELSKIQAVMETRRYEEILEKVTNEIEKIENDLKKERDNGVKELSQAKAELDDNKYKLESGKKELIEQENRFQSEKINGLNQINSGKQELENAKSEYEKKLVDYNNTKDTIRQNLDKAKDDLKLQEELLEQNKDNMSIEEYNESLEKINSAKTLLQQQEEEFLNAPKVLEDTRILLEEKTTELNNKETLYYKTIEESQRKLDNARIELQNNETKLNEGYAEYEKANQEFEQKISEAYQKIDEEKQKLKDIPRPEWYVLDRTDNPGYIDFKNDALRVDAIARVFPVFFLLVAALVCLNTMTRMVEEDRTQIGIFKALGYSNPKIMSSYIAYVSIATVLGSIVGLLIGYNILPRVIFGVYSFTYYLPDIVIYINPIMFITITLVALGLIMSVTLFSCYKELEEQPASLLRPKAPKKGKKIFLENIKIIWNRISFTGKVTIRNLFRYKKRIIMTIVGISGCTALTLTGFGLRDGISSIVKLQYGKVFKYDAMFVLNNDVESIDSDLNSLLKQNNIDSPMLFHQELFSFRQNDKKHDFYMMIPEYSDVSKYINLQNRVTKEKYSITDDGVIITEKMAELLNAKVGDNIKIRNSDNMLYIVKVNAIVENYAYHYMYMSSNYYEKIFGNKPLYNTIFSNIDIDSREDISSNLIESGKILNTNFTIDNIKTFDTMIDSLNKIVLVILGASFLLAFIVLYNLTTINITERIREIATIKVLGFYDREVSSYVYRETIALTIIGMFVGLFLGVFLHAFVMKTAEMDFIMFSKDIEFISFVLSGVITIIFSVIVQIITHYKLKKIDMIESLKSVE